MRRTFAMLVDSMGHHGRHPASQQFLMYEAVTVADERYVDVVRRALRHDKVAAHSELTTLTHRFMDGALGRFHFEMEGRLAACVLDDAAVPFMSQVLFRCLAHEQHLDDNCVADVTSLVTRGVITTVTIDATPAAAQLQQQQLRGMLLWTHLMTTLLTSLTSCQSRLATSSESWAPS